MEDKLRYYLKRVTADLHETRQRLEEMEAAGGEPIAIVGMGCRFPGGVRNPEDLWELLTTETDAISPLPRDRGWDLGDPDHPEAGGPPVQTGGFIYDAAGFDSGFFGISPREALTMDPQQRVLMEVAWEALEQAGIDPATLRGSSTGVFAGASASGYAWTAGEQGSHEGHVMTGNATSILSGRISYTLGLEGPAVTVDTACSSALVSLHLAVQSLRGGECSLALVGGAFVAATPVLFTDFNESLGLSPDGRCKSFASSADGMGVAEGAGVVIVERLSDARRNGHKILAVVRGSAVNQDGASNGLTAPNGPSQQRVIRAALASAKLSSSDVDVVEAHGTGTPLGDPIEAGALLATYGQERAGQAPLWLGSVKSNIGHAQQAAGTAGVIKMVLALQNQHLPRTLHAADPSPHIDWSSGEVRLLQEPVAWPAGERTRRAAVSGFGMSGTNVHVILEEAPADEPAEAEPAEVPAPVLPDACAWVLSGRSGAGLSAQAGRLREWVTARPQLTPADVAWSLATTRSAFEHRAVVLGTGRDELIDGLGSITAGHAAPGVRPVFVFAGQGAQWVGMGRRLLDSSPVFAARLAECEQALGWSVADVLREQRGLERADVVQPVLWAVMVSLAAVWEAAGVVPEAVVGHSQGEVAAATVAGMLSVADAARVVTARSQALTSLSAQGSMVSVVMPAPAVSELLERWDGKLSMAAINGPATVVVSGEPGALNEFERELAKQHVLRWRVPETDFVAHSPAVEPLEAVLAEQLADITPQPGRIPMASAVTGEWVGETPLDAAYWYANLRRMVRFEQATRLLLTAGYNAFVEVSPHAVLTAAIAETVEDAGTFGITVLGTLDRERDDATQLLTAFAQAWTAGLGVDWQRVLPPARTVGLPTYAFQHEQYWMSAAPAAPAEAGGDDAQLWAALNELDASRPLSDLLPELASWRRQEQDRQLTAGWRYRIDWTPVTETGTAVLDGTWLVVRPAAPVDDTVTDAVVAALTARGAEVVEIEVPPVTTNRAELAGLLTQALPGDITFAGVVSLLGLDETPLPGHPAVTQGLAATLTLAQATYDAGIDARLWVLTRGAVAAGAGDPLSNPLQGQLWGMGRVIGLEYPDRTGGLVDLPATFDERAAARLVAVLAGLGEDQVAIRPAAILARRLVHAAPPRIPAQPWVPSGTTLFTGGTGAIAGHIARWLAGRGAPRIVLSSRSGPAAPGTAAMAAQLAAAGTTVDVVRGDVGDRAELSALLSWIGPQLSAVMHTAGIGPMIPVARTTTQDLSDILAGKAAGATLLHELTRDLDLEAFVLFSSISAIWGGGLQSAYAAANAYLDALADHRRSQGLPATSVAWGPWGGGGMTDADGGVEGMRRGLMIMQPEHAVQALAQILDTGEGLVTIADIDWERFAPPFTLRRPSPLIEGLPEVRRALAEPAVPAAGEAGPTSALKQQLAGLSRGEQMRLLIGVARTETAAVLNYPDPDAVDTVRAFSDLGLDSLTAVELRNRLSAATELPLPATLLFDAPTVTDVAEFLLAKLAGAADVAATAPIAAAVSDEPIAIVGMSCRYPGGAHSPEDLWALLTTGTDAISALPEDRGWSVADDGSAIRAGGFVYDAAGFDAGFFGISPREAIAMDPQQRLLLEVAWEALERAGIDPATLRGTATGVFAGVSASGYGWSAGIKDELDGHMVAGMSTSVVSGRVSYVLGLEGPAVTVDTACSSSLVALHLACQALRGGEATLALAGGVMVAANPLLFDQFSGQMGLSPDGRCKPFSDSADGMGLAEGSGVLVVERLSDARRNGHKVLAVIRGSAINQDGASNGLTAPNGPSQQRVIRAALASAQLSAADIDVVEAHGTGTPLGDPIEAGALLATYGQERAGDRPLWLGSIKSNIGHTQAAAGAAGVIKMVLALQNKQLPRSLHSTVPSPHVDWASGEVRLLQEARDWTAEDRVRRAGVSSFGMSGTNAHIILEEAPVEETEQAEAAEVPVPVVSGSGAWVVSGRSADGLAGQAGRLREWIAARPQADPADVAWSLAASRSAFEHRAVLIGGARDEFVAGLANVATGQASAAVRTGVARSDRRPVFVFAGQGTQWLGMGRKLVHESPVFAARLVECELALAPLVGWSVTDVLTGAEGAPALERADIVQPVLWAVMVSLAAVWEAAGITPEAVVGHSQGEVAAATVAGLLSLDDGARVVVARSRALSSLSVQGSMVSVVMPAPAVGELLQPWEGKLSLAAVNSPAASVVSGSPEALAEFERELARQHVLRWRIPETDFVAHSPAVEPLEAVLAEDLAGIEPQPGRVPMVSTVTGDWLGQTPVDAAYWYANLRRMVRFEQAVQVLLGTGHTAFLEISPHPVLTAAVTETAENAGVFGVTVVATLERDRDDAAQLLSSLGQAWTAGLAVDWKRVLPQARIVDLPTYAFQHVPYWLKAAPATAGAGADADLWAALTELDDSRPLREVLPELASWRRQEQDRSITAGWRYRIGWSPVPDTAAPTLSGTWLVVRPSGTGDDVIAALTGRGAELVVADDVVPAGLPELTGVVSLLDTAGTLAVLQAGIEAPLWVLTRGAVAVAPSESLTDPEQGHLWGLGRVVALEDPEHWGGLIDLPPTLDERAAARLVAVLAAGGEDQVAIRPAAILARRLTHAAAPKAAEPFVPRGSTLITGGTGAIAGHVARWLAGRGAPRLVLTSRSGPAAPGAALLAAELAAAGSKVDVLHSDAGDRAQLSEVLSWIDAQGPQLSAVMHTAGVGPNALVQETTPEFLTEVCRPKSDAARHLHELTLGRELDAFVLFSSVSATWGGGLQGAYAAANAYLDALADHRRAQGLPATSVAWGPWGGGGMTDEDSALQSSRRGLDIMAPEHAVQALAQAIDSGEGPLTVGNIDWDRFVPPFTLRRPSPLLADLPEAQLALDAGTPGTAVTESEAGAALKQHLAGLSRSEQHRALITLVQTQAAAVLNYPSADAVEATRAFSDLGFDSLTAVELRNRLSTATDLQLPATLLFDCPNPTVLAEYLWQHEFQNGPAPISLIGEIDRLGSLLAGAKPDDNTFQQVAERLQGILAQWSESDASAARKDVADKIDTASDDEIFEFIHKELGR
ncbi:type I polyketide synthase [Actinoplanes sp. N902-109]|uniref:type I polyketide synthase n=1 Tax=Actinoplanes sp. (strain N902-109) TaxID=649831 RepID=UPI0003296066|nr:type I polyketide synthase [Actinoplanes sp. N902-109]AGL16001.1 acyl transferase [Actinoplanes sp. N902-109]